MTWQELIKKYELDHNLRATESRFRDKIKSDSFFKSNLIFEKGNVMFGRELEPRMALWPKTNIDKMKLTSEATFFLNNSQRGQTFVGVGDLKKMKLYVHPVTVNNERTNPAANPRDLDVYRGAFPRGCVAYNKYISHNQIFDDLPRGLKRDQISQEYVGPAHSQFLQLLTKGKMHINIDIDGFKPRFFGFSILNNGPKGNKILARSGKTKGALRIRSNYLNNHFKMIQIIEGAGVSCVQFKKDETIRDWNRDNIMGTIKTESANLPFFEGRAIANIISRSISNEILKNALRDFSNWDNWEK